MIDRLGKDIEMLARHLEVLQLVLKSEPIGIVKMSNETGYERHEIRYSLRVLENNSLINPSPRGATTTDKTAEYVAGFDKGIDHLIEQFERIHLDRTPEQAP